jgi:uncharacterized protein HemX
MGSLLVQARQAILAQPAKKPQPVQAEAADGAAATWTYDLFFHFGNNGGTSYGGGVYAAGAAIGAAIGAGLGLRKFHQQQEKEQGAN